MGRPHWLAIPQDPEHARLLKGLDQHFLKDEREEASEPSAEESKAPKAENGYEKR